MTEQERIDALELENRRLREAYDQGAKAQFTRDDLKTMSPQAINKAREDGRLADILNTPEKHTRQGKDFEAEVAAIKAKKNGSAA